LRGKEEWRVEQHGETMELIIRELDAKGRGLGEGIATTKDGRINQEMNKTNPETNLGTPMGRQFVGTRNAMPRPVPVPYTIPGERVRVFLPKKTRRGKGREARLLDVVEPHPARITPRCPHFTRCGGCVWQHLGYKEQLAAKEAHVKACFAAAGLDAGVVKPVLGMDEPWHYRNKMEFTFSPDWRLGLHAPGDFGTVIPLEECYIAGEEMVEAARVVSRWALEYGLRGYDKRRHEGLLRHLMVRQSRATRELMVALFATETPDALAETAPAALEELKGRLRERCAPLASLLWIVNRGLADKADVEEMYCLDGRDYIWDELCGFRYRLKPQTFFQVNPVQAERLVDIALRQARPQPDERMIDLFCGVGTFSLPFARRVRGLIGIEIVEASVEAARQNAADNGVANARFIAADARRGLDEVLRDHPGVDLLLLDPPRSGAGGKVMRKIGRARPERVVYVSCNPATLAEDCAALLPFGYELVEAQPVDMFPHTVHVECVVTLIYKGN